MHLSDIRIVAYKSAGLAGQNFMISMSAINYDNNPMENFDSLILKKVLSLPSSGEIMTVIASGIRGG